jgi:PilZ domain
MAERINPARSKHPKNGPATERRAWVRIPSGQDICCQPMAASTTEESETGWLGKVRDVSPGGIALLLSRRFEPGTVLIVELEQGSLRLPVRVVHATSETKGHWIIGCAFASALSQDELDTFLTFPERASRRPEPARTQRPAN